MEFKDVAHLYLGCKMKRVDHFSNTEKIQTLHSVDINNQYFVSDGFSHWFPVQNSFKPILRKWADRTADEVWHIANLKLLVEKLPMQSTEMIIPRFDSELMAYLLYRHFDLFDLIESGQAIDATTLTPNPYKNV